MRRHMAHLNGAGLAAPQIGVPLRVVIFGVDAQPALSRRRGGAGHGADQSRAHAARRTRWRRAGKAACRCPACAAVVPRYQRAALRGLRRARQAVRAQRRGLPRARGAARVRPPRRHPLSDADPRLHAVRLQRSAVPGPGQRRTNSGSIQAVLELLQQVLLELQHWSWGRASASPETRNTSSARSPSVLMRAVCRLSCGAPACAPRRRAGRAGRRRRSSSTW